MIRTAALSLRLLRSGGRRAWTAAGLVGAGIAVGTMLLAVALGALHGWDSRDERTGWRADDRLSDSREVSDAVAGVRVTNDVVGGETLQIVDVVDGRPGAAPPPGLPVLPGAGQVWVSPALAQRLGELPADVLADRLPGAPTGTIAADGLRDPEELVAVLGRAGPVADADPVAAFTPPGGFGRIEIYRQLTYVAVALMVFPVLSLLGASARLTAARRVQRLATMRLLGASTRQVTVAAVTEVTAVATVAAIVGVAAQWLAAPALAAIELGGSGWYAADLRPSPLVSAGIVLGVALLATAAAVGGMRQVVVGPLGVVRRQRAGTARLVRVLGMAAGIVVFAVLNGMVQGGETAANVTGLVFGLAVLALFGTVSLIGPLVVRLIGNGMVRAARSPARLLAGRRLLDDPRGAFRPLAGLTLAVFVAGFLAPLTASVAGASGGEDTELRVRPADTPPAVVVAQATERLDALGIAAQVTPDDEGALVVPGPGMDRDRVRTALAPVAGGTAVLTDREGEVWDTVLTTDLTRGAIVVLVATFLVAATSAGTSAAARVLDQRRTLRLLHLAGTPLAVLDGARRAETVRPLLVNGGIALALGLLCALPFAAATDALQPAGLLLLGSVLVAGVLLVLGASAASRPLLHSVATAPDHDH